jgi:hypothetical protein
MQAHLLGYYFGDAFDGDLVRRTQVVYVDTLFGGQETILYEPGRVEEVFDVYVGFFLRSVA